MTGGFLPAKIGEGLVLLVESLSESYICICYSFYLMGSNFNAGNRPLRPPGCLLYILIHSTMARGLKLTGFARFFLMLVVMAPLAYMIASYANGEDGLANLKKLVGIEQKSTQGSTDVASVEDDAVTKREKVRLLEQEVAALKEKLMERELELNQLKRELEKEAVQ